MARSIWHLTLVGMVALGAACAQHARVPDSQPPLTSEECIQKGLRVLTPQLSEALALFDEAIALDPTSVVALLNRGVVLARMGHLVEALESYDRALELDEWRVKDEWQAMVSTKAVTLANRGAVLLRLGRPEDSLESSSRAVEYQPDLAIAWQNFAAACRALGRIREAEAAEQQYSDRPAAVDTLVFPPAVFP